MSLFKDTYHSVLYQLVFHYGYFIANFTCFVLHCLWF